MTYTTDVSDEPLEVIRANECEARPWELSTKRFRALWNEILRLRRGAHVEEAIKIAVEYGGVDGAHYKDWVIDQMVRKLAGDRYEQIVKDACAGEDGPETYEWHTGVAP